MTMHPDVPDSAHARLTLQRRRGDTIGRAGDRLVTRIALADAFARGCPRKE
jgi:hypothetical protein